MRMRIRIIAVVGATLLVGAWAGADERGQLRAAGEGRAIFLANCASCHGKDARGGSAPSLAAIATRDGAFDRRRVINRIEGRRDGYSGHPMPAWGHVLAQSWPRGRSGAALKEYKLAAYLEFVQADTNRSQVAGSAAPR